MAQIELREHPIGSIAGHRLTSIFERVALIPCKTTTRVHVLWFTGSSSKLQSGRTYRTYCPEMQAFICVERL